MTVQLILSFCLMTASAAFASAPPIGQDAMTQPETAPPPDIAAADRAFGDTLSSVVTSDGRVRYDVLLEKHADAIQSVIAGYAGAKLPDGDPERLAFWCNAYNANVLAMIAEQLEKNSEFASVKDISGFFDERRITVAGESLTLNELEDGKIRPLKDPRVHCALVCGALSCPPLRAEPYAAARLDEQFDDQCRKFVNDTSQNRAVAGGLLLSKIFDWYGEDFNAEPFGGMDGFLMSYVEPTNPIRQVLLLHGKTQLRFLNYNWSLNRADAPRDPFKIDPPMKRNERAARGID